MNSKHKQQKNRAEGSNTRYKEEETFPDRRQSLTAKGKHSSFILLALLIFYVNNSYMFSLIHKDIN